MSDLHGDTRSELDEGERVAELLRAVDARAPETLHRRIQEMTLPRRSASRERAGRPEIRRGLLAGRLKPTLAAMAAAAAAGAAIALLTGGSAQRQDPSVSAASALTLRAATMGAPSESTTHSAQLDVAVDGVAFPYWKERFGWRSTGVRTDTIDGRRVTTVFYSGPGGSRIGYAIVGGTPAPGARGGTVSWREGVEYRLLHEHGTPVVTWQRGGRLCVLSGRGVSAATLVRLASWDDDGDDGTAVS
jgi:hypothetical protein